MAIRPQGPFSSTRPSRAEPIEAVFSRGGRPVPVHWPVASGRGWNLSQAHPPDAGQPNLINRFEFSQYRRPAASEGCI
jgi:hypothetical protein